MALLTLRHLQPGLFDPALAVAAPVAAPDDLACAGMSAQDKRSQGITLTPEWLVDLMLNQVAAAGPFDALVDPGAGTGTGRFCIAAARRFPSRAPSRWKAARRWRQRCVTVWLQRGWRTVCRLSSRTFVKQRCT